MIRITRKETSTYENFDPATVEANHKRLERLTRGKIPPASRELFSTPILNKDQTALEWYTNVGGHPTPIAALPEAEQQAVRQVLNERLAAFSTHADTIEASSSDDATFLRELAKQPKDDKLYVVDGKPVITDWGYAIVGEIPEPTEAEIAAAAAAEAAAALAVEEFAAKRRGKRRNASLLLSALLLAGIAAALWWFVFKVDPYDKLSEQIAVADCEVLPEIAENSLLVDAVEPRYIALRETVEQKLADCAYESIKKQVEKSIDDCDQLTRLNTLQPLVAPTEPRYIALKEQVADANTACSLERVKEAVADAGEDCTKLQGLYQTEPLLQTPPSEGFEVLQTQVNTLLGNCQYDKLKKELDDASCPVLADAITSEPLLQLKEQRFIDLLKQTEEKVADCTYKDIKKRVDDAKEDCKKTEELLATEPALNKAEPRIQELRTILTDKQKKCTAPPPEKKVEKKPEEKKVEKPKPVKQKDTSQLCAGERPKESAPEFVVVLDASGSMSYPMSLDAAAIRRLEQMSSNIFGAMAAQQELLNMKQNSPSRMSVAKNSVESVIRALPGDVSAGLVLSKQCPQAQRVGFFSPAQRGTLLSHVNSAQPTSGTPLGDGVQKGGSMVNGVSKPAVMVVVSDGTESCGANVCAIGRQLAKSKPKLTINVVDIMGVGAANCLAQYTGGRVFKANNAAEVARNMERAAESALGPKRCRKK